jgi:hypothetical protein
MDKYIIKNLIISEKACSWVIYFNTEDSDEDIEDIDFEIEFIEDIPKKRVRFADHVTSDL